MDGQPHDKFLPNTWTLSQMKTIVSKWQDMMLHHHGWNALYLENHDQPRSISRFASDAPEFRKLSAKMLATFLALQSGTPYIYQGQEIGQINVPRSWGLDRYRDIETLNHWQDKVLKEHPDDPAFQEMMLGQYRLKARDNARTPMQWNGSNQNAGFTDAQKPWMDVHPDYQEWNVENQVHDPDGVFGHWKAVLALRKEMKDLFVYGDFEMLSPGDEESVAYIRRRRAFHDEEGGEKEGSHAAAAALVLTNFKDHEVRWQAPEQARELLKWPVRLRNYDDGHGGLEGNGGDERSVTTIRLRPFEALVFVKSSRR